MEVLTYDGMVLEAGKKLVPLHCLKYADDVRDVEIVCDEEIRKEFVDRDEAFIRKMK